MRSPCCLCVCIPPINFKMPEPIFMKLGMCIMAPEPISTAYFINPSQQSVYMCIVTGQRLCKQVPEAKNVHDSRRIVEGVVIYTVHVVSKEGMQFILRRTCCYLMIWK
jgi:hypothetical protein